MMMSRVGLVTLLFVASSWSQVNAEAGCKDDWTLHSGYCYKLSSDALSWKDAAAKCAAESAKLTTDLDQKEHDFLMEYMKAGGVNTVWIGMRLDKYADITWEDGSDVTTFQKWDTDKREPNEYGGGIGCGRIVDDKWNDRRCTLGKFKYICKTKVHEAGSFGGVSHDTQETILQLHNRYRSLVAPKASNMVKMVWSAKLEREAQTYADNCAWAYESEATRKERAGFGIDIGQSLVGTYKGQYNWSTIVRHWSDESANLDYGVGPKEGRNIRHYSQLVSAISTHVGCGFRYCPNLANTNQDVYVCDYAYSVTPTTEITPYKSGDSCADCPNQKCTANMCDCGEDTPLCKNGGMLDIKTCSCKCDGSWTGRECDKH